MERRLTYLLRQATTSMRAALRHGLGDLDLTPVQNTVLHLVATTPGSSSADLARRTHVSPQTMHKLVTELEHRGLLKLHPRPGHGRIRDAELTDEGRRLLTEADVRAQTIEDRMTAGLDDRQRRQLIDLLQHCVTALDTPPEEPGQRARK
ncbi:MarR family winged helix-turn-helix transcriptional regulator [Streptomyces albicerus]|uniref:MarR family winged helix-turn-helix transcriptional regulator n=1 Tax=Streptomyces albicerus TaxID=2569859 RepID=UPI00124B78E5|nr:MarR family transcriptional regulator [Streptomyces albicerus]